MKITERYIKMCEKAEEIQRMWKSKIGDWVQLRHKFLNGKIENDLNPLLVVEDVSEDAVYVYYPESIHEKIDLKMVCWRVYKPFHNSNNGWWWWVWLPTQEQLQEMVKPFLGDEKNLLRNFALWLLGRYSSVISKEYIELFDTGNEVTLAFVMWERYQKVWDDEKEEWVKGGNHEV